MQLEKKSVTKTRDTQKFLERAMILVSRCPRLANIPTTQVSHKNHWNKKENILMHDVQREIKGKDNPAKSLVMT
jgi:hypothetical protein